MRHGHGLSLRGVPAWTTTAVSEERAAHHHGLRHGRGVDAFASWPGNRRHPLSGASPPGRTCLPDWPPQIERSDGHGRRAYASRAGRIYPSRALLSAPRLPAALCRCRGHSRIFSTAPRKALRHAAGAHSIFVGPRIPAGRVFAKFFLDRAILDASRQALRRSDAP